MAGTVDYVMTEQDYVAANRDWMRRAILNRRALTRYAIIAAGSFLAGVAVAGLFWDRPDWSERLLGGLAVMAYVVVVLGGIIGTGYLLLPRRPRRLFRQQAVMRKPLGFAWSDDGMIHRSAAGEGSYAWSDFHRWQDGRSGILIYQTDNLFHILPHRVLDPGQRAEVIDLLTRFGPPRR